MKTCRAIKPRRGKGTKFFDFTSTCYFPIAPESIAAGQFSAAGGDSPHVVVPGLPSVAGGVAPRCCFLVSGVWLLIASLAAERLKFNSNRIFQILGSVGVPFMRVLCISCAHALAAHKFGTRPKQSLCAVRVQWCVSRKRINLVDLSAKTVYV